MQLNGIRILLITRFSEESERLVQRLSGLGCSALAVSDAGEGLSKLSEGGIDILILDHDLPNTEDGPFLQTLSDAQWLPDIPVIVIGPAEDAEARRRALEQGASEYLVRPVDEEELITRVKVLARHRRRIRDLNRRVEELQNARDEAWKATRAKSEFLANMSHEIRNPMNGVIGMTDALLKSELQEDQRDLIETIRTSGESLVHLINDILDFSKLEAGGMELEEVAFGLKKCVEDAVALYKIRAAEKNLRLKIDYGEGVPEGIVGDVNRLRQILVNLLGNAVKFTRQGEITLKVCSNAWIGDQCELAFTVRDTGKGIPSEKLSRLFNPFSQLDASTSREFGGTGLGLVISKNLVELMGGKIWAESEPGQGSQFHFTIRVRFSESLMSQERSRESVSRISSATNGASRSKSSGNIDHASLKILVTDDNLINQKVATQLLGQLGCRADIAQNGFEAVEACQRKAYDIVYMDVQMPRMDGFEATRQIRQREAAASDGATIIIAMTANAMPGDREKCLESGMDDYIAKPIRPADLENSLKQWSPKTRSGSQAARPSRDEDDETAIMDALLEGDQDASPKETGKIADIPPVDMERMLEMSGGDDEGLQELIEIYLNQTSDQFEKLTRALKTGSPEEVKRISHSCAGASATCGMKNIVEPLRTLERLGKEGDLSGGERELQKAAEELDRIREFLSTYNV